MRFPLLVVCALLLQVPAKADKYWLSDATSAPAFVEGVLIAESDEGYHVRVRGGEVLLPKKLVLRIEKDALSVDDLVAAEKAGKAQRETSEQERRTAQAAPAPRRMGNAAEASATRDADAAAVPAEAFDPVLDRTTVQGDAELQRDLQLAWSLTKDRRYLRLLRQQRRLH
jgi:hypothetical protein